MSFNSSLKICGIADTLLLMYLISLLCICDIFVYIKAYKDALYQDLCPQNNALLTIALFDNGSTHDDMLIQEHCQVPREFSQIKTVSNLRQSHEQDDKSMYMKLLFSNPKMSFPSSPWPLPIQTPQSHHQRTRPARVRTWSIRVRHGSNPAPTDPKPS